MPRTRERWRIFALTAVLLGHAAVILVVLGVDRERRILDARLEYSSLELVRILPSIEPPPPARARRPRHAPEPPPLPDVSPPAVLALEPPPPIDWIAAAQLAARNGVAELGRQGRYNDFSGLSAAQQQWLARNELEPVAPGIPWGPPRVELTPEGLPIIHVNEHCIVVPVLAFLMFCKVGHIEANAHLFDHLRDPRPR